MRSPRNESVGSEKGKDSGECANLKGERRKKNQGRSKCRKKNSIKYHCISRRRRVSSIGETTVSVVTDEELRKMSFESMVIGSSSITFKTTVLM